MGPQASVNGAEQELEARLAEREVLDAVSRAILNHAGLRPLIDHLLQTVLPLGPFDAGWVRLIEPGSDTTTLAGAIGAIPLQRDTPEPRRLPLLRIAREVMKSGHRAKVVDDIQSLPGLRTAKNAGLQTAIFLPISEAEEVLGCLVLGSRSPLKLSSDRIRLLETIANHVGIAVKKARLFEETERRARELAAVHAVTAAVSGSLDLELILLKGLDAVLEVTEMEAGYVRLLAGDPPGLVIKAHRGMSADFIENFRGDMRPGGKTEQIIATKKPLVLENIPPDHKGKFQGQRFTAAAWVPITAKDQVIGILAAASKTKRTFPQGQLPLLASIGNALSTALENARLFADTRRNLERIRALHEINLAVTSTLDLKSILDALLERIDRALPFPIVALVRTAFREGLKSGLLACRNIAAEQCPQTVISGADGLSGVTIERKTPLVIPNALKDPRTRHPAFFKDNGLVSYLGLPLVAKGETLGTIGIFTKEEHTFTPEEIEFLSAVASHGAAAIHNSQLYREAEAAKDKEKEANRQLSELLNQTTALYSALAPLKASENPHRMLESVMDRLLAATGADAASVRTFDEATQTFAWMAHRGIPLDYLSRISRTEPGGKVRATYNTGQPLFIADISRDPRARRKRQLTLGLRSAAYLPVKVKGAVQGVLYLASRTAGFFSETKRPHLMALSRLMEIVFENRDLFDEVKTAKVQEEAVSRQLSQLLERITGLYSAVAPLDLSDTPEQMLESIIDRLSAATGADAVAIRMFDEATGASPSVAHRGFPPEVVERLKAFPEGGNSSAACRTGQAVIISDIAADLRPTQKLQLATGFRSCAYLPFKVKGSVKGILHLASRRIGFFSEDQREHILTLSRLMEIVFENRQLFEETDRRVRELAAVHAVTAAVSGSLDLEQILLRGIDAVLEVTDMDAGYVQFIAGDPPELVIKAHRGMPASFVANFSGRIRPGGKTEQVVATKGPVVLENIPPDHQGRFRGQQFTAAAFVPILTKHKTIGVLTIVSRTKRTFPKDQLPLLASIGNALSVALENARLFEETERGLERIRALHEINLAVTSTLDLKSVLDTLLEKIERALPFPIVAVLRVYFDREGPAKGVLACRNIAAEQCLNAISSDGKGFGSITLKQQAPLAILNVLKDPRTRSRRFFQETGLVSCLGFPLIAKGEALGVLGIFTKQEREFSNDEIRFLSAVANHGATAIYNSRLYREAEAAKEKEETVNRQLAELLNQTAALYSALAPLEASEDPHRMFENVMDRLLAATGADAVSVRTFDEATQGFVWLAHRGFPLEYLSAISPTEPGGKVRATYTTGRPLFIADISTDPSVTRKRQVKLGFRSSAYLPLKVKGVVKGVFYLASRAVGFFSEEKRDQLAALSRLMEIAFENRNLFDEVIAAKESLEAANERHRMRAIQQAILNHFSHLALSSKAIPSLLEEAVLHISQVLHLDCCAVFELLPGGEGLILRAGAGWAKDLVGRATVSSQWDSEAGYTLLSNEPVVMSDLGRESRFTPSRLLREHGVVSGVTIAIEGQERPFGVIGAYTTSRRNFTDEEIHFLLSFAYVVATAVDRARAEHKLRESQHKYENLVESIDGIVWEAEAQTFHCRFVSRQAERILGYPVEQWLEEPGFWLAHLHPDDREWAPAYVRNKTEEMRPHELEFRMVAADGKVVWLRSLVTVIAEEGRPATLRGICVDVTERKRMEMEVSEISERERQKIGQDLHDELGQLLTGIACIGAGLAQRLEAQGAPEAATAGQIATLTNQAIHQTRALARGLYPVELQTNGLASALKELAAAAEGMFGISCRLDCDPEFSISENDVAIHLYRIAQEAVDNAVRHGKARRVRISVERQNGRGVLSVIDDGIGFSKAPPGYKGMGLRIMKTRAELIKGGLEVRRGESGGTVVERSFRRSTEGEHAAYV